MTPVAGQYVGASEGLESTYITLSYTCDDDFITTNLPPALAALQSTYFPTGNVQVALTGDPVFDNVMQVCDTKCGCVRCDVVAERHRGRHAAV